MISPTPGLRISLPAALRRIPLPSICGLALLIPVQAGLLPGCGGDARVELAAADALEAAATQMQLAFDEYNAEIDRADRARQLAAVQAFVIRIRADADHQLAVENHTAAFTEALEALWADQRAEWQRYHNALSNLESIAEIAAGLRRVAVATLTLNDEVRRYLDRLIQARRRADAATQGE